MRKIRKFYTQRVLPLVYDYSLSQYEVMNKLTDVVNTLAEDDEEYDHRLDTCEHNIEVLSDRVDVANRGVDNLGERVTDIENELENIPTDDRIEELQQGINQNSADIADLDNRVETLENAPDLSSQVSVNTADISDIKGDIRDINSGLDSHAQRISDCEDDISDLQTAVNSKSTVSYNQIIATGNKIGEITINGNTTDIYSPTAPTPTTPTAADVSYDNTTSGLSASNVQAAIDEVDSTVDSLSSTVAGKSTVSVSQVVSTGTKIATVTVDSVGTDIYAPTPTTPTATDVSYDNTTSGLSASNVQSAIDELDNDKSSVSISVASNTGYAYRITADNRSGTIYTPYPEHDSSGSSPRRLIYNLPRGVFAGHLTTGSKDIYFFVPTSRDYSNMVFPNNSYFTGTGTIRGVGGNVVQSFDISQYVYNHDGQQTAPLTFTVSAQRDGILIMLHSTTAYTGTNNTPVSVYLSNFKFNQPY